ncbi:MULTISPECIES: cell division protein FtsB [Aliagarivorans]|uniref:cell division protein FtsB n=1 Tax=Aliagarivorans TaxID=882379 RepID=UPI00042211E8|nr:MULTISPECIES: cell division protein FtsB [Aliagarivorans]
MRPFKLILVLLLLFLQYELWFGKNSLNDFMGLREQVAQQQIANQGLGQRNQVAAAEIDDLRSGLEAVEELARHELGMIKPGETFYRLVSEEN